MSKGLSMWRSFIAGARACGPYRQLWSPWRQQQMVPSDEHQNLFLLRTQISVSAPAWAGDIRRSVRAKRRCLLMSGADPFNEVKGEVEAAVSQLAANKSWPAGRVQEAVEQIEFDLGMLDESIERRASTRDRARILTRHP